MLTWGESANCGGSPGGNEPYPEDRKRGIVLNEHEDLIVTRNDACHHAVGLLGLLGLRSHTLSLLSLKKSQAADHNARQASRNADEQTCALESAQVAH